MMSNNQIVSEKMLGLGKFPVLTAKDSLKKALDEMTKHRLGIACFTDESNELIGILTDGDLRRLLLTRQNPLPALLVTPAIEFGHSTPTSIHGNQTLIEAESLMHDKQIWDLPVIDTEKKLVGLIHRHDVN
jgi:DeoR family transcriptional regulator, catabolite repression regulator